MSYAQDNPNLTTTILLGGILALGAYVVFFRDQEEEEEVQVPEVDSSPKGAALSIFAVTATVAQEVQAQGLKVVRVDKPKLLTRSRTFVGRDSEILDYAPGNAWLVNAVFKDPNKRGKNKSVRFLVTSDGYAAIVDYERK
jgi:hypothetical protein